MDYTAAPKENIHIHICQNLTETYMSKNADYGDSFSIGRKEIKGYTLSKLHDKFTRLKTLMQQDKEPNNESIEDNLLDLANYCIMEVLERRIENGK